MRGIVTDQFIQDIRRRLPVLEVADQVDALEQEGLDLQMLAGLEQIQNRTKDLASHLRVSAEIIVKQFCSNWMC